MKLRKFLIQPEIHIFLFCIFVILLCLPLLTIAGQNSPVLMFIYLFPIWGFLIALLYLINRMLGNASGGTGGERGDSTDV